MPVGKVRDFCRRSDIRRLSLFGSVIRDDFTNDSDVDVLVEFEPGYRIGLMGFAGLELELTEILGRKVDLNTPQELSPYYRQEVLEEALVLYDKT